MAPKKTQTTEVKVLLGRPKGSLSMGLVGLPNVGKSTTFNVLSRQSVPAENYPFCTIDPHEARLNVEDSRFKWLCKNFKPRSEVPASLAIFDIAGLVPGAHKGEGLGNAFLSHIQKVDGIYQVVRMFDENDIVHTEGEIDPIRDLKIISDELRLKDIDRLTHILEDKRQARNPDKSKKQEVEFLKEVLSHLEKGFWISSKENWKAAEVEILNDYYFLTAKPVVYLLNMSEHDYKRQKNKWLSKVVAWVKENNPGPVIPFSAKYESALMDSELVENHSSSPNQDSEKPKSCIKKIVTTGYNALSLIHYFTCGSDEVKCWTIREGTKAPQAAGIIHSDFEKAFICANVYKYEDLVNCGGSEATLKAAGKLMQRGKEYVVEDGDILFFKCGTVSTGKK